MPKSKKAKWDSVHDPAYAYANTLTADGWAWEFMRRTNRYRLAYVKYQAELAKLQKGLKGTGIGPTDHSIYSPRKKSGESNDEWLRRVTIRTRREPQILSLDQFRGRKFDLSSMFDPALRFNPSIRFVPLDVGPQLARKLVDLEEFVSTISRDADVDGFIPSKCVLAFDLTRNLDAQIKRALALLEKAREERPIEEITKALQFKRSLWIDYLRVLDAKDVGLGNEQIGLQLWPDYGDQSDPATRVKAVFKQARDLAKRHREIRYITVT